MSLDPSKVRVENRGETVHDLAKRIEDGSLQLPDDYSSMWASSKLVESLLIQVPAERLWFKLFYKTNPIASEPLNNYTWVFVATIKHFLIDDRPLTGLIYLRELEGEPLSATPWIKRRIENTDVITSNLGDYMPDEIIADLITRFPK